MTNSEQPRRVVKLGGSLLALDFVAELLRRWLDLQSPAEHWIVIGGGEAVDQIAARQQREGFDDAAAHWLCIRVMQDHSNDWRQLLPEAPDRKFVDPWTFLKDIDARDDSPLPESWAVTSDSIAARFAEHLDADELVLLKSTLPTNVAELGGYVDDYFVTAAKRLRSIRFVNLRDAGFDEVRYR